MSWQSSVAQLKRSCTLAGKFARVLRCPCQITALEASSEVPKMEIVTERLLHEERKQKEKDSQESSSKALYASRSKKGW